jgi:hypothetical protein
MPSEPPRARASRKKVGVLLVLTGVLFLSVIGRMLWGWSVWLHGPSTSFTASLRRFLTEFWPAVAMGVSFVVFGVILFFEKKKNA